MSDAATLRRTACRLLMFLLAGFLCARIFAVENVLEPSLFQRYDRKWPAAAPTPSPTFSANDRARWSSVRALVDRGTWAIGRRVDDPAKPGGYRDEGILFEEGYRSIDVVLDPKTRLFYSTKPPLLTVLVAGEYGLLKFLFGWDIDLQRWQVVCTILITLNVLPFLVYLYLLEKLIEEMPVGEAAKLFTFATACFGTFLTTFAITLNNHTPAAFAVLFALYPWVKRRAELAGAPRGVFLLSGLCLGFAASLDLPATALAGMLALFALRQSPRRALLFASAFAVPLIGQAVVNYAAIGEWQPIYAKFGGPWYEFPGSHWEKLQWRPRPPGIDFLEEPKSIYAFHLLFGHHGWFSLTPVFAVAVLGMVANVTAITPPPPSPGSPTNGGGLLTDRDLRILTAVVASVVFAFYVFKTNNYGGFSSGPRWLFWLTPLFLLHLPKGADTLLALRGGRTVAGLCLAVSAFSVSYPLLNPWRHPWMLQLFDYLHWIRY